MSVNFATLQGLSIPEGVVTQITDASGRVIWAVQSGGNVILEVKKITSNTYAGETTYNNEQFILLDIYPKTNGTVKVTYGGLTKTITDTSGVAEPNAQRVFFGTFNGVSDSVATPTSGELTIEGDYAAFGCGLFDADSKGIDKLCACVTEILDYGTVQYIPANAFGSINGHCPLTSITLPNSITSIGEYAFYNGSFDGGFATELTVPESVKVIESYGFAIYGLKTVTVLAETPPTPTTTKDEYAILGRTVSSNFVLEKITVPTGRGEAYKAAKGWSEYANLIVEAS